MLLRRMLSRAFRRQCTLCCKRTATSKNVHMVSQGRHETLLRCLPASSTAVHTIIEKQRLTRHAWMVHNSHSRSCSQVASEETDNHDTEPETDQTHRDKPKTQGEGSRTLWLRIPNSDVIVDTVYQLSRDILDVQLYRRVEGLSYAFLVFGSTELAEKNYDKLKADGMDIEYLDVFNRTLFINLGKKPITEDMIRESMQQCEDVRLTKLLDGRSYAYVMFPTEKAATLSSRKLRIKKDKRTESVVRPVDYSRSLWLGYFEEDVTTEDIRKISEDEVSVLLKQTADGRMYAYLEYESEELAEKNYQLFQENKMTVKYAEPYPKDDKDCVLYTPIEKLKELERISSDIREAFVVKTNKLRCAYLMFETKLDAERNYTALRDKGYSDISYTGQNKNIEVCDSSEERDMDSLTEREVSFSKREVSAVRDRDKSTKREVSAGKFEKDMDKLKKREVYVGGDKKKLFVRSIKKEMMPYLHSVLPDAIHDIRQPVANGFLVKLKPDCGLEEAKQKLHDAGLDVNYHGPKGGEITRRTIALYSEFLTEEEVRAMIREPVHIYRVHHVTQKMKKGSFRYFKIVFPNEEVVKKYCWKFEQQNLEFRQWTSARIKNLQLINELLTPQKVSK